MFRLSQHIRRCELWIGRGVGQDNHFTGTSDGIDIDVPENKSLCQRNEQVTGTDYFVDGSYLRDPVRECRHRLCAANCVDFANPQLPTNRKHIRVISAQRCRGRDDRDLLHTSALGWHCCHEHRRGVGGGSAWHANPHPIQRRITLLQDDPWFGLERDVPVKNSGLKQPNVVSNSAYRY